jgi:hypothetical protein
MWLDENGGMAGERVKRVTFVSPGSQFPGALN